MSHTTSIRRAASVLGAAGLIALSMAAPASARQDPGTGGAHEWTQWSDSTTGDTGNQQAPTTRVVDDNAVEVLQLGAGILAGVALAGAAVTMASRRSHNRVGHPA
jgi:hypothetical protein